MTLIEAAAKYIGEKEKPGNSGFHNPVIEKAMLEIGWRPGWAYCILACKRWAIDSRPELTDKYNKLFTPNVQKTFDNFKEDGYQIGMEPRPNSIVFWSSWNNGLLTMMGHAGACEGSSGAGFSSIEGNTDAEGGRDGDGFHRRSRAIVRIVPPTKRHLIVEGFLYL